MSLSFPSLISIVSLLAELGLIAGLQPPSIQAPGQSAPIEDTWEFGPVRVTRQVSHRTPFLSDLVSVSYEIQAPPGLQVRFSEWGDWPASVVVSDVNQTDPDADSGMRVWARQFSIDALLPGEYRFPALEISYRRPTDVIWTVEGTEYLTLEFRSVLGDDPDEAEPRPNPGPLAWPMGSATWAIIGAAVASLILVGGAAVAAWVWRSRRPRAPPRITAYRKAMDAMHRINMAEWLEKAEMDRFYTELSGVIRRYIEDRFGLRAPELTTEEFLQELTSRPVLGPDQNAALSRFLERCDLVKFARARPTASEGQAALRAARAFVEATRDDSVLVPI